MCLFYCDLDGGYTDVHYKLHQVYVHLRCVLYESYTLKE